MKKACAPGSLVFSFRGLWHCRSSFFEKGSARSLYPQNIHKVQQKPYTHTEIEKERERVGRGGGGGGGEAGEGGRMERVRVRGDVGGRRGEGRERQVRVEGWRE